MKGKTVGIIGCGNMAQAMVRGLLDSHYVNQGQIIVSDPDPAKRDYIEKTFGIKALAENEEVLKASDIVIFAIKPADMTEALKKLKGCCSPNQLFITIAAGYPTSKIKEHLGQNFEIARAMPNTPANIGEGATGLYLPKAMSDDSKRLAEKVFKAIGRVVLIKDEEMLDAVTAVSGSGPAYLFYFLEAMIEGGINVGLPQEIANQLAIQTVVGASNLIKHTGEPPDILRKKVTSTGGTTAAAIDSFTKSRLKELIKDGIKAAYERSKEIVKKVK